MAKLTSAYSLSYVCTVVDSERPVGKASQMQASYRRLYIITNGDSFAEGEEACSNLGHVFGKLSVFDCLR